MTANQILNNYLEALKMSDSSPIDLQKVVLDILKYLSKNEGCKEEIQTIEQHKAMFYQDLWKDITEKSDQENITVFLPDLRKILEKYHILGDEKDGR